MLKDNFNIQRDMSSSEASLPGQQQWAAREVARLARDRAQGSPGRESTENIYLNINIYIRYIFLFNFSFCFQIF